MKRAPKWVGWMVWIACIACAFYLEELAHSMQLIAIGTIALMVAYQHEEGEEE